MNMSVISYKHHRFAPEIIARAEWLCYRFPLSLRLVEEMLLERGIVVSYETIRGWGRKFGSAYAKRLHCKKPSHRDIWHLDEVVISISVHSLQISITELPPPLTKEFEEETTHWLSGSSRPRCCSQ